MSLYKIVGCLHCRALQITTATKSLKCSKCSKSTVFSKLHIFYQTTNGLDAKAKYLELKDVNDKNTGFYNADKENFSF
jgi:hypothetical protein